jgi:putative ABC transport system permease protein
MKKNRQLNFNRIAPDLTLQTPACEPVQLSSLWAEKPLLLAFTRHFGCTQCKEMLDELTANKDAIEKAGLRIAVVTQGTPEATAEFAQQYAPGLFVLADPERKAYQAFGLERGNLFQTFLNPKVWSAIAKSRKKGYQVEPPPAGQDAMQMSGTFIINRDGKVELPYYYDNIADHPSTDLLLNGVLSTGWNASFDGPIGPATKKSAEQTRAGSANPSLAVSAYLALKEIWRNRGRFFLVSLVIALITLLVLFIAALGEGLGNGNREYISKLDGQLLVYHAKSDYLIQASRLSTDTVDSIRKVAGVADAGMIGTANATLVPSNDKQLKVALLGVEPGHVGEPPVTKGRQLAALDASEVIIDRNTALRSGLKVGDDLTLRVTQGTEDVSFTLKIVGISSGQQFSLQPSILVPFQTWNKVRPQSEAELKYSSATANVIAVKLADPQAVDSTRQSILSHVEGVDVASIKDAIQALPGYSAQQSTLNTQGGFTLFIGILVIGGFFQIQLLQKVPQIGVLKAIGTSNPIVAAASVIQIVVITLIGVAIGGFLTYLFSLSFPPTVPIVFNGTTSAIALAALLVIGPLGGLVSIRYAVRIEPLKALGLN